MVLDCEQMILIRRGSTKKEAEASIFVLAPPPGFEPGTFFLTGSRSTVELQGNDEKRRQGTTRIIPSLRIAVTGRTPWGRLLLEVQIYAFFFGVHALPDL